MPLNKLVGYITDIFFDDTVGEIFFFYTNIESAIVEKVTTASANCDHHDFVFTQFNTLYLVFRLADNTGIERSGESFVARDNDDACLASIDAHKRVSLQIGGAGESI